MLSPARLVVISRPMFAVPSLAVYLGAALSARPELSWLTALGAAFIAFPMGLIVYGINDIADRESDASNPRKGGVDGAVLSISETATLAKLVAATMVIWAVVFAASRQFGLLLAVLVIYMLAYAYSVRPLRLKSRPGLDSLANGIWVVCIFLAGYWSGTTGSGLAMPRIELLAMVLFFTTAYHALTTAADYDVDKAAGDRTVSIALGKRPTLLLCAAIFAACIPLVGSRAPSIVAFMALAALLALLGCRYDSPRAIRRIYLSLLGLFPLAVVPAVI